MDKNIESKIEKLVFYTTILCILMMTFGLLMGSVSNINNQESETSGTISQNIITEILV